MMMAFKYRETVKRALCLNFKWSKSRENKTRVGDMTGSEWDPIRYSNGIKDNIRIMN